MSNDLKRYGSEASYANELTEIGSDSNGAREDDEELQDKNKSVLLFYSCLIQYQFEANISK